MSSSSNLERLSLAPTTGGRRGSSSSSTSSRANAVGRARPRRRCPADGSPEPRRWTGSALALELRDKELQALLKGIEGQVVELELIGLGLGHRGRLAAL